MSQKPVCIQCNGTDFFIESGFYFCSECQTQSQDVREEVHDEFYVEGQIVGKKTKVVAPPSTHVSSNQENDLNNDLTSWEVMNYVLKGLVNELIFLGCDKKIKIIVLQLWSAYLNKLEVAFISSLVEKKPRVGISFKTRDAEILYGTKSEILKMYKKPIYRKKSSASSCSSSISSKIFSFKRLKLAKAVYEKTYKQSDASDISFVSLENLETKSPKQDKKEKFKYTKHAKDVITKIFSSMDNLADIDLGEYQSGFINRERKSWRHARFVQVISILRLSLLVLHSDIHLCDLFRWSQEGYLSIGNCEKLLPEGATVEKDIKALLSRQFFSWLSINKQSTALRNLLGVTIVNVDILPICRRFIQDLHLPEDILPIIEKLLVIKKPKISYSSRSNYEGRAAALIIFVLKLLFGLDDSSENYISEACKEINNECYSGNEEKLFVWSDWCKFIECRSALISIYHSPTRDLLYPGSGVGSLRPFIGQWEKAPIKQIIKRVHGVNSELAQGVNLVLGRLGSRGIEPLRPSIFYFSSLFNQIREKSILNEMPPILDSYAQPATKYCVAPFLNCNRTAYLAKSCGIEVVEGSSKEFSRVEGYIWVNLRPTSKKHISLVPVNLVGDGDKLYSDKARKKYSSSNDSSNYEDDDGRVSSGSNDDSNDGKLPLSNRFYSPCTNLAFRVQLDSDENYSMEGSKKLTLFQPFYEYWFFHGDFYDSAISIPHFDEVSRRNLPLSFLWLLKQFSLVAQQSPRDIYRQLMLIEKLFVLTSKSKFLYKWW